MDASYITFLIAIMAALAVAATLYVFLGRKIENHDRSARRVQAVSKGEAARSGKGKKGAADPAAQRRRNVQDSLKDLEEKQTKERPKVSLRARLEGAGLTTTPRDFYVGSGILGVLAAAGMLLGHQMPVLALGAGFAAGLGLPRWALSFLTMRRRKMFVKEFANALDVIVRGVKTGLPVAECLKIIASESPAPVGPEFVDVVDAQRMGIPLDQALQRLYERMPVPEVNFFMIVLTIQQKTGGNLSEALSNLARVLRDRKRLEQKIESVSSEAKASAMIIGSLPFVIGTLMFVVNSKYMSILFEEKLGHFMMIAGGIWMSVGVLVMKKMMNVRS